MKSAGLCMATSSVRQCFIFHTALKRISGGS